ncbi:hypothetical protein A3K93_02365 [Acinetobacter sp. NCu2D-2]|uniref:DUF2218 domain-containing protein n=1 Tax=Acinetobacter sp. NCu2D-2 TaxID=1608473 RepID=UPI0007CDE0DA|nr:DUF2218 domain-containing protein [Acinetobacter sp. NCu2D-2]ANF83072.1 hypothetical protein A3K93_02365 [Acinetobacter sp. NCu2D-2]
MMSTALIPTFQAERMTKRLVKHWEHKFPVQKTDLYHEIQMPTALVRLTPLDEHLQVEIKILQPDVNIIQLQKVVIDHLERMSHQTLTAQWQ